MKKITLFFFLLLAIFLFRPAGVRADFAKIDSVNNKFGIHLAVAVEEDLKDAAELVNSSGGDWGYVTVVIEEKDRDQKKWQDVFDQMRRFRLIPIVRLATSFEGNSWRRPKKEEAASWADFLNSLNWVVKNRYVVLFNEPNHATEWGGEVDGENYGQVALTFARTLKEKNEDFFLMLAGLDALTPQEPPRYEQEKTFLRQMFQSAKKGVSEFADYFDGWASHSYQPKTYLQELDYLFSLGLKENWPVFITEAGWPHAEGIKSQNSFPSENIVAQKFLTAFTNWNNDSRVVAITPFILNYQGELFDHFSWRKPGTPKDFYSQYFSVQAVEKAAGQPTQEQKLVLVDPLPKKLIRNSTYELPIKIRNDGQAIWDQEEGYWLQLLPKLDNFEFFFSDLFNLGPFEEKTIRLYLKTKDHLGRYDFTLAVTREDQVVSEPIPWSLEILPALEIQVAARFFPGRKAQGDDFKFLIYNSREEVVGERTGLKIEKGLGKVDDVHNLAIGEEYRLVLLKPYFLPRQAFLTISEQENKIEFKPMLPVDFNLDGKFSGRDLIAFIKTPRLWRLWLPW